MSSPLAYVNGEFVPLERAVVSVEDRGFLFADGIYEVIRVYGGRPFRLEDHLRRLEASARAIELPLPAPVEEIGRLAEEVRTRNDHREAIIYIQVTRGPAPRHHLFPERPRPTLVIWTREIEGPSPEMVDRGVACITVPDTRWALCEVKTVGLLPNVLARQQAARQGAYEAIFVRGGVVTEASSSNVFAVLDGVVYTHPVDNILPGVTRTVALELLAARGIPARQEPVPLERFRRADEIFLTGTTTEICGVTRLDGQPVGDGRVGPITRALQEDFRRLTRGG